MNSSGTTRTKGKNTLKPSGNQWRKNDHSLARQLHAKANPNANANAKSAKPTASNAQSHLHYRQQHHPRPRPNQWRNPNGNNNGRNNSNANRNANANANPIGNKRHHYGFDPTTWLNDQKQLGELTTALHDTLHSHGVFEHGQGSEKRLNVLNRLEHLLNDWSDNLMIPAIPVPLRVRVPGENEYHDRNSDCKRSRVRLISFGSYRLGVHAPDADLDLLVLAPPHVTREDFFSSLVNKLGQDDRCNSIHPIPGAYTPVIKFYMDAIPIDMLFVRLVDGKRLGSRDVSDAPTPAIAPAEDANVDSDSASASASASDSSTENRRREFQIEDDMLQGLDGPSSRSLNGVRVAQYLLKIIPNQKSFRIVLKTVKEWAQVHGLYSNVLGFLGGVNWAILVAWVCKRNPEASPPVLLKLFFQTFSRWHWPKPVILTQIENNPPQGLPPLAVWNPALNPRDRAQIMPIITPCYPSMNSSYNVAQPQLRRLKEELFQADKVMNLIANGNAQWSDLLKENGFFKDHLHYLQVSIIANNEEDHRAWFGLCESRLRILIAGLDSVEYGTHAYPFAKFFTTRSTKEKHHLAQGYGSESWNGLKEETPQIATSFFIALRFSYGIENVDLIDCTAEYSYSVNNWEERKQGMDLCIGHVLQKDLPPFVFKSASSITKLSQNNAGEGSICSSGVDSKPETVRASRRKPEVSTVLSGMQSPDECLASPMKRAKISRGGSKA